MKPFPLSVVILTHNEVANLKTLLPTLGFAAEIIIIDDNSSDNTATIVKKFRVKYFKKALNNDFATQRNYGLEKASEAWVLFIDPDERINHQLIQEIGQAIGNDEIKGFYIPRRDIFLGKLMRFGETGSMALLRLGKKNAGRWQRSVHEVWEISPSGKLKTPLLHYAHQSLPDFKQAVERYSQIEAEYQHKTGIEWSLWKTVIFPIGKFIKSYLIQMGFRDGWPGLWVSLMMSYHSLLVRFNLLKLKYSPGKKLTRNERRYWLLQGIIWVLLIFGQLTRISLYQTVSFYVFELLMLVSGAWFLGKSKFPFTLVWKWSWIVIVFWGFSLGVNWHFLGSNWLAASLYWWRVVLYGQWGYGLSIMAKKTQWHFPFYRILIYLGWALTAFGIVQYLFLPDMRFLFAFGWDDHYYRLIGTIFDPNYLGLIISLTMILLIAKPIPYAKYFLVMSIAALALTFSRGSYLAFSCGLLGYVWLSKRWKYFLIMFGLFMAVLLVPKPGGEGVNLRRTYSIISRRESYLNAWNLFQQHPWFGIGFNAYKWVTGTNVQSNGIPVRPSGPDNSFLLILVTTGVIGMMPWLIYMGILSRFLVQDAGLFSGLIVILIHSLVNNSWFYPWVMIWVYLLILAREQAEAFKDNN